MSLFIAGLAFPSEPSLIAAKEGILIASTMAGLIGWLCLRRVGTNRVAQA